MSRFVPQHVRAGLKPIRDQRTLAANMRSLNHFSRGINQLGNTIQQLNQRRRDNDRRDRRDDLYAGELESIQEARGRRLNQQETSQAHREHMDFNQQARLRAQDARVEAQDLQRQLALILASPPPEPFNPRSFQEGAASLSPAEDFDDDPAPSPMSPNEATSRFTAADQMTRARMAAAAAARLAQEQQAAQQRTQAARGDRQMDLERMKLSSAERQARIRARGQVQAAHARRRPVDPQGPFATYRQRVQSERDEIFKGMSADPAGVAARIASLVQELSVAVQQSQGRALRPEQRQQVIDQVMADTLPNINENESLYNQMRSLVLTSAIGEQ
jgi:hypothetical protein